MSTDNIANLAEARQRRVRGGGEPPQGRPADARPLIRVEAGDEVRAMREAEDAMLRSSAGVYQRAGQLVKVARMEIWAARKEKTWSDHFVPMTVPAIVREFTEAARFEKWDARAEDYVTKPVPEVLAKMYGASADSWRVPTISAVVNAPTLRPDGSVLQEPGLDPATGLLYAPLGAFPPIPEAPTRDDALEALGRLKALIRTFAFEGGGEAATWENPKGRPLATAHRSVALSAILTAVARLAMPVAPVHGFSSTDAGAGKSKLVDVASMIAVGHRAPVTGAGEAKDDDPELEKRMVSSMLAGERIISIDNLERPFGSGFICTVVTQEILNLRILGKSVIVPVPNTFALMFTGVNVAVLGDMIRRTLVARIDPGHERAELDRFRFDPVRLAERARPQLVVASLTVLRAWLATRAIGAPTLGGFEAWSRIIRGALLWLGEPDPVEVIEEVRDSDPRLAKLRTLMSAWATTFGSKGVTLHAVRAAAQKTEEGKWVDPDLRNAAQAATSDSGNHELNSNKLDWYLKRSAGRRVDGMRFVRVDDGSTKVAHWQLEGADAVPVPAVEDEIPF